MTRRLRTDGTPAERRRSLAPTVLAGCDTFVARPASSMMAPSRVGAIGFSAEQAVDAALHRLVYQWHYLTRSTSLYSDIGATSARTPTAHRNAAARSDPRERAI